MSKTAAAIKVHPDSYYLDESKKALAEALQECNDRDISDLEEIDFILRRAYPFGAGAVLDNQRAYKQWNKVLHAKQAELGIAERKHQSTIEREAAGEPPVSKETEKKYNASESPPPKSLEEIESAEPVDLRTAEAFLRRYCVSTIKADRHGDQLRIVLKTSNVSEARVKFEYFDKTDPNDKADYDVKYLEAAKSIWKSWSESQRPKFE